MTQREADFCLPLEKALFDMRQSSFIQDHFGLEIGQIYSVRQVHEENIIVIQEGDALPANYLSADGVITNKKKFPIAIRTADCVPVFMYAQRQECIGLIHAGWRGTQKGIVTKAIQIFQSELGAALEEIQVVIGPCIRECCYEVGDEFRDYFPEDIVESQGFYLNLPGANKRQMLNAGISPENIFDAEQCTCCSMDFYSYRREGSGAGRMLSLMMKGDE